MILSGQYRVINRLRLVIFQKNLVILCRGFKNFLLKMAMENPKFFRYLSLVESADGFLVYNICRV